MIILNTKAILKALEKRIKGTKHNINDNKSEYLFLFSKNDRELIPANIIAIHETEFGFYVENDIDYLNDA